MTPHSEPFQDSISPFGALASSPEAPAAIHDVVELHDTLLSRLSLAPEGVGAESNVHSVPFQRSARLALLELPTATHADAVEHETLCIVPPLPGATVCTLHIIPFQRSTMGMVPPVPPTAVHALLEVQDTALSLLMLSFGLGDVWSFHSVPFQLSATVESFILTTE